MSDRTLRGKAAIVGIGETPYYKHGGVAGCRVQAGADGGGERLRGRRHQPARRGRLRLLRQRPQRRRPSGRGAGLPRNSASPTCSGAAAAAACAARWPMPRRRWRPAWPTAWWRSARWRRASSPATAAAPARRWRPATTQFLFPYGLMSPAQRFAMKVTRFMHDHGIRQEALRAISLACYHHAQNNPQRGDARPHAGRGQVRRLALDHRAVLPPVRLLPGERRRRRGDRGAGRARPGLAATSRPTCWAPRRAATTAAPRRCTTCPSYPSSHFAPGGAAAVRRWRSSGRRTCSVVQCYENFTGGVLMSLVEHGLVQAERGQRVPGDWTTCSRRRRPAAEHQRRQPGRVLHARAGTGDRGGAPDPRRRDQPGASATTRRSSSAARW